MMKKKRGLHKKLTEKLPSLKRKRGAKVMYKLLTRRPRRPLGVGTTQPKSSRTVKL